MIFGPLADTVSVQSLLIVGGLATIGFMTVAVMMPSGRLAVATARETSTGAPDPGDPLEALEPSA